MVCRLAAIAHPNRKGAVLYAEAIKEQLQNLHSQSRLVACGGRRRAGKIRISIARGDFCGDKSGPQYREESLMNPNPMEFRSGVISPVECLKEGWQLIKDQLLAFSGDHARRDARRRRSSRRAHRPDDVRTLPVSVCEDARRTGRVRNALQRLRLFRAGFGGGRDSDSAGDPDYGGGAGYLRGVHDDHYAEGTRRGAARWCSGLDWPYSCCLR